MRLLLTLIACMALFAGTANAAVPTQTITVVNQTHLKQRQLDRIEAALVIQSKQLRSKWDTPIVQFGAGGWEMDLIPQSWPILVNNVALGWHGYVGNSPNDPYPAGVVAPYAYVGVGPMAPASVVWSHELMEMLADPTLDYYIHDRLVEICDPLESTGGYYINGVNVASFVLPGYFFRPSP